MPKVTRAEVYAAINGERDYQDAGRGNAARHQNAPPVMTMGEYILCMEKCLADARTDWYRPQAEEASCLEFVRKVTALGVAMMEHYGAPPRR
jgi:hypothetical protein